MEEGPQITAADAAAFINDEPIPSIDGIGDGESIEDTMQGFDQESLFGPASAEEQLMEDAE